jgi:hypothetical protein
MTQEYVHEVLNVKEKEERRGKNEISMISDRDEGYIVERRE